MDSTAILHQDKYLIVKLTRYHLIFSFNLPDNNKWYQYEFKIKNDKNDSPKLREFYNFLLKKNDKYLVDNMYISQSIYYRDQVSVKLGVWSLIVDFSDSFINRVSKLLE